MENVVDDFQRVKLLLLGDSRVGKTMLRGAFLNASAGEIPGRAVGTKERSAEVSKDFDGAYLETLGCESTTLDLFLASGEVLNVDVWDCSGHPRYLPFAQQVYDGANAACIVFDVTSAESFKRCAFWREEAMRDFPSATLFLVGAKCDVADGAKITEAATAKLAAEWQVDHALISSKTGVNIINLLRTVATGLSSSSSSADGDPPSAVPGAS